MPETYAVQPQSMPRKTNIRGPRHVNFYGGSPLNRLSWLRPSQSFLNAIVALPETKWLLLNAGQPLVVSSNDRSTKPSPIYLSTADVQQFLGPTPYFGQGKEPGELVVEIDGEGHIHSQHSPTEAARHLGIPVVFLGLHETQAEDSSTALLISDFSDPETAIKKLNGIPYFAVDVADLEYTQGMLEGMLNETTPGREGKILGWSEPRAFMTTVDGFTAAMFASARSILDWNQRNKVGVSNYSLDPISAYLTPSFVLVAVRPSFQCGEAGNLHAGRYFPGRPITIKSPVRLRKSAYLFLGIMSFIDSSKVKVSITSHTHEQTPSLL